MTARVFGVALGAVVLLSAARASADDVRRSAASAYDRGSETYLHHEYDAAADWFELADRLAPDPLALEGAVKAHRRIGSPAHLARAATLALRLRARASGDAGALRFADETLAALAPIFGRVAVRCGGCELQVDGSVTDARDLFVPAGDHRFTARWTNGSGGAAREESRSVHALGGSSESIDWAAPPEPRPSPVAALGPPLESSGDRSPAPAPASSPPLSPAYAIGGLAVTAALGTAAAIVWFADAKSGGKQLITEAEQTHRPDPALQSRVDNATHATVALDVAAGVAGAATLITGLFFTRWRGDGPPATVGLAPLAGGGLATVGASF